MPNLANKTNQKSTENLARPTKFAPISMESIKKMSFPEKQAQPAQSSSVSPLHLTAKITSLMTNKAKFGLGLSLNSPMKSSRKSVHAYRQRRRELSYRFMKEVGMSVSIRVIFYTTFWLANNQRPEKIHLSMESQRNSECLPIEAQGIGGIGQKSGMHLNSLPLFHA